MASARSRGSRQYSAQSGGLHQLWGLLLGNAASNVETNPEYVKEASKIAALNEVGDKSAPKLPQSSNQYEPIRAKSFLAKGNAAEKNADYRLDEISRKNASEAAINQERELSPILLDRAEKQGIISNQQRLALEQQLDDLKVQTSKKLAEVKEPFDARAGDREMLNRLNIPGQFSENVQNYQGNVTPGILKNLSAKTDVDNQKLTNEFNQAELEGNKFDATRNNQLTTSYTESDIAKQKAAGELQNLPDIIKAAGLIAKQAPALNESRMMENRIHSVSPGGSLVDTVIGKPIYQGESDYEKAMNMSKGGLGGNGLTAKSTNPYKPEAAAPQGDDSSDIEEGKEFSVGGNTFIKVNGKIFRVNKH